jgi:small subunit ribosomal protein S20
MASHKSAAKKSRQDVKRRARNRMGKSRLKTALKGFRALLAAGSSEAVTQLPSMIAKIDKSAKCGFIHKNAANRLKSKLSLQTNARAS